MPIKFYCIKCGQRLSIASNKAGKLISCPACHNKVSIPHVSEPRRPDSAKSTPEPPPQSEKHSQPVAEFSLEEDQLLTDLDDFASLGDSWDEILEDDWKDAAAAEESVPPLVEAQTHDEKESPQNSKSKELPKELPKEVPNELPKELPEVLPEQILEQPPEELPQTVASQPKVEQVSTPSEATSGTAIAPLEIETHTQNEQKRPPESQVSFVEDDDDDDDDDDGFKIRTAESEFEEMDLTPMVDVTFLLLIFFMITASFSLQKSIQVPPPNPDEDGVSQSLQTLDDFREESIIVEIDNNNGIYVDDTKLSNPSEIVQAILDRRNQDGKTKSELVLSAHKAARHETVVAVVDAANEVGMQKIRLASYRGPED